MMGVIGQITGILGVMMYESKFKDIEIRTLIYYSTWVSAISSFFSYFLALRLNQKIHISDGLFIVMTDTVFGILS